MAPSPSSASPSPLSQTWIVAGPDSSKHAPPSGSPESSSILVICTVPLAGVLMKVSSAVPPASTATDCATPATYPSGACVSATECSPAWRPPNSTTPSPSSSQTWSPPSTAKQAPPSGLPWSSVLVTRIAPGCCSLAMVTSVVSPASTEAVWASPVSYPSGASVFSTVCSPSSSPAISTTASSSSSQTSSPPSTAKQPPGSGSPSSSVCRI